MFDFIKAKIFLITTGILISLGLYLGVVIYQKNQTIQTLEQNALQAKIAHQKLELEHTTLKNECLENAKQYEKDLLDFNATVKTVEVKKVEVIKKINEYKGDKNANDSQNANNMFNDFTF